MQQGTPDPVPLGTLAAQLVEMASGYQMTQLLYTAAELGLADLIATGPKSIEDLAQATATHGPSLYRLLRAPARLEIFMEREDGQFDMTPLAQLLQTGQPGSMRAALLHFGGDMYRVWGELRYSVATGESSFPGCSASPTGSAGSRIQQ